MAKNIPPSPPVRIASTSMPWGRTVISPPPTSETSAALVHHRLADGEQHHHHADADGEAQQQEQGAKLPDPEMAKGEGEQHQSRIVPSSMWITRPACGGQPVVVGHDHERGAVQVEAAEELEDLMASGSVELAGGLIGEQDGRAVGERAGDGHPLHLAA